MSSAAGAFGATGDGFGDIALTYSFIASESPLDDEDDDPSESIIGATVWCSYAIRCSKKNPLILVTAMFVGVLVASRLGLDL